MKWSPRSSLRGRHLPPPTATFGGEKQYRVSVRLMFIAGLALAQSCAQSSRNEAQAGNEAPDGTQLPPPIIDVHLHAFPPANFGTLPPACAGEVIFPAPEPGALPAQDRVGVPQNGYDLEAAEECSGDAMIPSATTHAEMIERTVQYMEQYNIIGVVSGSVERVSEWRAVAPDRVIPAVSTSSALQADSMRKWAAEGNMEVIGELLFQYRGIAPTDSIVQPYFALAEELDLPVAFHIGFGPPATPYVRGPTYRARHSDPLLLEDALIRHPNMRIYLMEAAWPMLDQLVALLYAHPQVYVDIGRLTWEIPRAEFHTYLRRLVEAGFGKRIMWGSDAMQWPDVIPVTIEAVESAEFLNEDQKRDIFYNNAAQFLRLSEEEIARHHGR